MKSLSRVMFLAAVSAVAASAQTTFATITGSVHDPNGLPVQGAEIEATNTATNYKYSVKSNDVGVYTVSQLVEGSYTLHVRAGGFREYVANDITLAARDVRRLDIRLELGTVESKIEV